jgi:hypothetical protein
LACGPFRAGLASIVLDFVEVCRAHSLLVNATGRSGRNCVPCSSKWFYVWPHGRLP